MEVNIVGLPITMRVDMKHRLLSKSHTSCILEENDSDIKNMFFACSFCLGQRKSLVVFTPHQDRPLIFFL
jgi:hypothetical protein